MKFKTTVSGWGNYPKQTAELVIPSSYSALHSYIKQEENIITRGMGRSYGDSANGSKILKTSYLDHFIEFDDNSGKLTAEAGITLREMLKIIVSSGWFLPVTPGTSFVTLGGAIASDVHGKNHHVAGTFGEHIISIRMLLGTGEVVTASQKENKDLFYSTCGGMGLTGIILSATIQLIPIKSSLINQKTIKADCIETVCEAFETNSNAPYSVAWVDSLAKGKNLGRSILILGEHEESGGLDINIKNPVSIPFNIPSALNNIMTLKTLNSIYWHKTKHNKTQIVPLTTYFYPLDVIGNWNKFYGKTGFLQYQFVIPKKDGVENLRKLLTKISKSSEKAFLIVLKQFGKSNDNLLSFPIEGYTMALDFKLTSSIISTLHKLDELVNDMGGRVYLTKDAIMQEPIFKSTYPQWEVFECVRKKYGAIGKFSSTQSKRLGLA